MKNLIRIVLFAASAAFASAAQADAVVTFTHDNGADPTLEYVVEYQSTQTGTWVEIAKGPTSPITYSQNLSWGAYTVRVMVRVIATPLPRDPELDTSTPASTYLYPGKPTNPAVQTNRSKK